MGLEVGARALFVGPQSRASVVTDDTFTTSHRKVVLAVGLHECPWRGKLQRGLVTTRHSTSSLRLGTISDMNQGVTSFNPFQVSQQHLGLIRFDLVGLAVFHFI